MKRNEITFPIKLTFSIACHAGGREFESRPDRQQL